MNKSEEPTGEEEPSGLIRGIIIALPIALLLWIAIVLIFSLA